MHTSVDRVGVGWGGAEGEEKEAEKQTPHGV